MNYKEEVYQKEPEVVEVDLSLKTNNNTHSFAVRED